MYHVFYCVPPSNNPLWDSSWADKWEARNRAHNLGTFAWVEQDFGAGPKSQQQPQVYQRWLIYLPAWSDGPAVTIPEVMEHVAFPADAQDLPGYATRDEAIAAEVSNSEAWP